MVKNSYLWFLIAAVVLLSVQVLAVIVYIYSFIPLTWDDPLLRHVEPKRDTLFYALFLVTNVVLMVLGAKWVLPHLSLPEVRRKFKFWLGLEALWCFLILFCFFKWTTYRYPFWNVLPYENSAWLRPFFCIVCGLAVLSKIFFPEIEKCYASLFSPIGNEFSPCSRQAEPRTQWFRKLFPIGLSKYHFAIVFQGIFIGGVALLLYIPHPEDVVALALAWDQWNHLDQVAGWFIKQGWFISYETVIQILVATAIIYVVGVFYAIRLWLGSLWLAMVGALLVLKLGLFYYGTAPCVWTNPANTFLAHGWSMGGWTGALGYENQPMMAPLRVRQFFPFFMGYFVPVFYVFSLLFLMGNQGLQGTRDKKIPVALGVYGLVIFTNYIEHPAIGFYGPLMVPAILLGLWWLKRLAAPLALSAKRGMYMAVLLLIIGALLTNRLVLIYPNIIFQDRNRFIQERAYAQHFDAITQSASLISQLAGEGQKAALLSNFETALLMQAKRQPLFKDFPVMFSNLNGTAGGLNLKTKAQGLGAINDLSMGNPLYVFVDERLLALPPQALAGSGLGVIMDYLNNHYAAYMRRGFLEALQRK